MAFADVPPLLARHAPIVVHDRRDSSPLTSVADTPVAVPGVARDADAPPTVYARRTGGHLQYWLFYRDNPQDRGIVRTGRHEGDWELVQVGLDAGGAPESVLVSQHSSAESCSWSEVSRVGERPVVYAANGSHAGYLAAGTRDRTWPDPNDEATGNGLRVVPRVVEVSAGSPRWMAWPGRWGASRASVVPGESDSPRGPAFQGVRWDDPAAFAASARPCGAVRAPANRVETAMTVVAGALSVAAALLLVRRRCGRGRGRYDIQRMS